MSTEIGPLGTAAPPATEAGPSGLTAAETAHLGALLDRMFPADDLGPGAIEIGVLDYLLRAFAGPYAGLVPIYCRALAGLDATAQSEFGRPFVELAPDDQDTLVGLLEQGKLETVDRPEEIGFFELIWRHLREGLFADPIHGGNRDMLGWRLIGFPGAQRGYTAEEQRLDVIVTREPRSVADLPGAAQ